MATQQEIDDLSSALEAADRAATAGDASAADDARALAAELDRISGGAPAQAAAPAAGGGGFMDQLKRAMADNMTGGKAVLQGVPGVGKWTDELAGKAMSALHGGDPEENRQAYMADVESLPQGRRTALELGGAALGGLGLAAAAPAAVTSIPAMLASSTALGAIEGAGGNEQDRMQGAAGGAAAGLVGGAVGGTLGGVINRVAPMIANAGRRMVGAPVNPYTGAAGRGAQEVLRESADTGSLLNPGVALTSAKPLAEQAPMEAAARSVISGGGVPAAKLIGTGRDIIERGQAGVKEAGKLYQDKLGIPAIGAKTRSADMIDAPDVSTPRILNLLENNIHVRKAMNRTADNPAFENISPTNLGRLQAVKAELASRARAAGKKGAAIKNDGLRQSADELDQALSEAVPGYSDVTQNYAQAVSAGKEAEAAGKAIGGKRTYVPISEKRSLLRVLHNAVSNSIAGVAARGTISGAAELSAHAVRKAQGKTAERIVKILKEQNPDQIQMAIDALKNDTSGKTIRSLLALQGPGALAAWQREAQ